MSTSQLEINRIFQLQSDSINLQRLKNTSAIERIAKIRGIEKYLNNNINQNKFISAMFTDLRKPAEESLANELVPTLINLAHILKNLSAWMRDERVSSPISYTGLSSFIRYEPKGCILIISPWNYPFQLSIIPLMYAIAAGNAIIIKPSEYAVATSAFVREMVSFLFKENEVCVIEGDSSTATELLEKPFHHIFFTGSPNVGKIVMHAAARNLASITLELGGKSPLVIDETVNIKWVAEKTVWAKTMNCGQTCIAPDYLLIHESKKEEFIREYEIALNKFYNADGSGIENSKSLARIINKKNFIRVKELVDDAIAKGAVVLCGGQMNEEDLYISPTILDRVNFDMTIMQEEIFAPVLPLFTFNNKDEIIEVINKFPKPLALYIFSNNRKFTKHILHYTAAGTTAINEMMVNTANPHLPFGGSNNSGIGKSNGRYGFIGFSNERGIVKRNWGTLKLIYPPYNKTIINWLIKISRL